MQDFRFSWYGGHPVLDLVNTFDERVSAAPVDKLVSYEALASFAVQAGLMDRPTAEKLIQIGSPGARADVHARVLALREALWSLLQKGAASQEIPRDAAAVLERSIRDALDARELAVVEGRVTWAWRDSLALLLPLHMLSLAVQDFFAPGEASLVKRCAATDCGGLFLDTSRTHRRRWCSMAGCGNRDKVRRYRAGHDS